MAPRKFNASATSSAVEFHIKHSVKSPSKPILNEPSTMGSDADSTICWRSKRRFAHSTLYSVTGDPLLPWAFVLCGREKSIRSDCVVSIRIDASAGTFGTPQGASLPVALGVDGPTPRLLYAETRT